MKLMKLNIQKFANSGTLGTLSGQWKSTYTVSWSLLSQSTANNESTIRLTSTFYTGNSTTIYSSNSSFITDGTTMYSGSYSQRGAGTIFSKTKDIVVKHNDDGSFPNTKITFSASDGSAFSSNPSGSGTIYAYDKDRHPEGVPSIPRTSVLSNLITTISNDGKTVTLRPTITKYLSSFYDRLILVNGSTIIVQIDGVSNNTSITLNDSQISALYREMGNSTSKSFSAYLTTYTSSSKGSTVGTSSSINTIVTLPDYDLSISSATIEDSITTYDNFKPKTNVFIANISKPKMTFSAISTTGNTYGNTISYRINDVAVSSPYTVEDYKGDKYTLIATDGRKQTSKEFDMTVVPYFKPTIQATVKRTSPTGSTADVLIEGKYYLGNDLTNILTPTYIIKYTPKGGQQLSNNVTVTTTTEGNEVTFKGTTQLTNLDYKKSIDWKVEITDIIGYVTSVSDTLKQGFPVWNAYEKNDEQYFNVNGVLSVKKKEILDYENITDNTIKFKNNLLLDSTGVVHNDITLKQFLEDFGTHYKDNEIVPTNEYLNGQRIHAKRIITNKLIPGAVGGSTISIPHGISNYDEIWIDTSNSYLINGEKRSIPIISNYYTDTHENSFVSATVDGENVLIMSNGGWAENWKKVVTVKFIYK